MFNVQCTLVIDYCLLFIVQCSNQLMEFAEWEHVVSIAQCLVRVRMHFEEIAGSTESLGGQCHGRNKLAVA